MTAVKNLARVWGKPDLSELHQRHSAGKVGKNGKQVSVQERNKNTEIKF